MDPTSAALKEHAFQHLFIEVFGWDRTRITTKIDVGNAQYALNAVAQKRGFLVFVGQTHRTVLADRQRLRRIQTKLRRGFHEHILILYSEVPRKQVWQWVAGMGNGSRLVHREHPFFSDDPPEQLLERLTQLAVPFDAEGQTTLLDIAAKGRHALFPADERNLFVRKPIYANESDRLALAVKNNEPGALPRFVKYHLGLAKYGVKRLTCWFEMEEDDARQIAVIGLIHAARRFDPGRGIQFSRYAYSRICKTCQILGVSHESRVRIPPGVFWDCYRLAFDEERVLAEFGPQDLEERLAPFFENAGVSPWQWRAYCNNKTWQRLSDVKPRVVAST
ncbi:MAG: hypothetical protein NT069_22440 [Planctomycetota bacterium]|nr:hypothetical protein [Planctomycetota bacterium]